jgi:hypothetical protein
MKKEKKVLFEQGKILSISQQKRIVGGQAFGSCFVCKDANGEWFYNNGSCEAATTCKSDCRDYSC